MISDILHTFYVSARDRRIPTVSEENGRYLHDLVVATRATSILELGTANGYSTLWLGLATRPYGGTVTSIDRDTRMQEEACLHGAELGLGDTCIFIESEIIAYLDGLDPATRYDFIFIDAMKKETLEYFKRVYPLLREGGVIVVDDVIKFRVKMEDFFVYLAEQGIHATILPIDSDDGVAMIVKPIA